MPGMLQGGEILENEEYEEVTRAMGLTDFPLLMAQYLAKS